MNEEIIRIRKALGLSQMKFAALVGVSLPTVQKWECGASKPSPENMEKLKKLQK